MNFNKRLEEILLDKFDPRNIKIIPEAATAIRSLILEMLPEKNTSNPLGLEERIYGWNMYRKELLTKLQEPGR